MSREQYRKKTRVMVCVEPNLYKDYKSRYNFSRILNEILLDFSIIDTSIVTAIESNKVTFYGKDGKEYTIQYDEYKKFISFMMDISRV